MPPYDRRARQRGFNTRIAIPTLSGGVGRQAPSKRLLSEAQEITNALPTLEKSIEKRAGSKQLVCKKNGILKSEGGLGLPGPLGASATITIGSAPLTAGTTNFTFNDKVISASTITLTSTDETEITYIADNYKNTGSLSEASTSITFTSVPVLPSFITLVSADSTSKNYISTSGTTGDLVGSSVGFNYGTFINDSALNLQEAIYSSNGHNASASNTMKFSGGVGLDETIILTSTDGTERTYICKNTGANGDLSGTDVVFLTNTNARTQAQNLVAAINSANGHSGKITASDAGGGNINMVQDEDGVGSTSRLILSNDFISSLEIYPKNRFGKLHVTVGTGGLVTFEQCTGGATGDTAVATGKGFNRYLLNAPSDFSRSADVVFFKPEGTATENANALLLAIDGANGHTSSKLTVANASGKLTITQVTTGTEGNTSVVTNTNFNNSITKNSVPSFSGGADINAVFNDKSLTLEDANGSTQIFEFFSNIEKSQSKNTVVGTKDLSSKDDIITELASVITNSIIGIEATYDSTTSELRLTMTDAGGNGKLIKTNDTTLFSATQFRSGLLGRKYFFYWFSISDDLRYLVVIDYSASGPAENLFYIYRVNTDTGVVEDQTPENQNTDQKIYDYITYGNNIYDAEEALDAITIGTNIFFVNKFVKAGFSSNKEGYKFDLSGIATEEIDYKGKELTYYTSSVVDPEGKALLYVPNKAYVSGTEVYNAYGVWKALTDIRSETTAQLNSGESETSNAADPGPPDYLFVSENTDRWYPYGYNGTSSPDDTVADPDGPFRKQWEVGDPEGEVDGEYLPTPSVLEDGKYYWKETVSSSNGIIEEEGDIVYNIAHSRRTCDSSVSSNDCHSDGEDYYISLWQYVRPVAQIPAEDNRYVDRTKQYLGQAYSDFSNVKLPPHPSDPTDIIDFATEAAIPDGIPNYQDGAGNLVGEAAIAMGLLYEDKKISDYEKVINNTNPNLRTHEDGLGKIIFVENAYADSLPGFYRVQSTEDKPFLEKVRTPYAFSRFDEERMPHVLNFSAPDDDNPTGGWEFSTVDWNMRTSGTDETNPGPKLFENGKQVEIKAMGYFRNRMWLAGEDKVFSSSLNNITNFFLEDPASITDEDPIDITCSYNKYTEVVNLTPFENNLFVNTGSDVQFTVSGSDNLISPFTAEVSPTSFYSTAPLIKPILLGSQVYFFDKERLYIYFNDKTVSINNAVEVSYHVPNYLPAEYGATTVVPPYDTLLFVDKNDKKDMYCYTNRYSGERVIQNAFFKYSFDRDILSVNVYDSDIYYLTETFNGSRVVHHIQKQKFQERNYSIPLLDNRFDEFTSATYDEQSDETTFVFAGYFNDNITDIVVDGESLNILSFKAGSKNTTVSVQGKYSNPAQVYVGTSYSTVIQLSPIYYRDDNQNVVDGVLSLRTMHIRHHNTGNYDIEINNRNRITTPIKFSSKEISTRNDLTPLENFAVDGETVSKVFGFGDEVKISILSDYISPMNITNIELKGRFNATYSSWVR